MFKQVVFFFCIALLIFGGYQVYITMAPAENVITWTIEETTQAFNEKNKDAVLAAFADDYKDSSQSGDYDEHIIDKSLLQKGLDYMFTNRVDAETGDFLYKIKPVMQTLSIKVESETHATAQLRVILRLKMGHTWTDVWGADVTMKFRNQGRDWVISRSSLRTQMGACPWSWE